MIADISNYKGSRGGYVVTLDMMSLEVLPVASAEKPNKVVLIRFSVEMRIVETCLDIQSGFTITV